jgi:hypothetical protein
VEGDQIKLGRVKFLVKEINIGKEKENGENEMYKLYLIPFFRSEHSSSISAAN